MGSQRWTSNSRRAQGLSRYNTLKNYYTHTAHVLPLTQAITHTLSLTHSNKHIHGPSAHNKKTHTRSLFLPLSALSHTHTCTHSFNHIHTHTFLTPDCFVFRSRNCKIVAWVRQGHPWTSARMKRLVSVSGRRGVFIRTLHVSAMMCVRQMFVCKRLRTYTHTCSSHVRIAQVYGNARVHVCTYIYMHIHSVTHTHVLMRARTQWHACTNTTKHLWFLEEHNQIYWLTWGTSPSLRTAASLDSDKYVLSTISNMHIYNIYIY